MFVVVFPLRLRCWCSGARPSWWTPLSAGAPPSAGSATRFKRKCRPRCDETSVLQPELPPDSASPRIPSGGPGAWMADSEPSPKHNAGCTEFGRFWRPERKFGSPGVCLTNIRCLAPLEPGMDIHANSRTTPRPRIRPQRAPPEPPHEAPSGAPPEAKRVEAGTGRGTETTATLSQWAGAVYANSPSKPTLARSCAGAWQFA